MRQIEKKINPKMMNSKKTEFIISTRNSISHPH
jgi:hypothetical protein